MPRDASDRGERRDPSDRGPAPTPADGAHPPAHSVLDAILRASPDLLAVIDRHGCILDLHPPRGWEPPPPWDRFVRAERGADHIPDVLPAPAAEQVMRSIERVLATGEPDVIEMQLDATGEAEWFESRRVRLDDDTTLVIVRDISDRHRAEAALQEALDRYRRILDTMREGLLITDADGRITFTSAAVTQIVEYPRDEIVGRFWPELLDPAAIEEAQRVDGPGDVEQFEFPTVTKHGRRIWLHANASRLVAGGVEQGFLVTIEDVTEQRAVAESRLELLERLEAASESERTRLSQELHDGPIQQLAAAAMRLGALRRDLSGDLAARAHDVEDAVLETVGSLRRTMFVLQGPQLDRFGLGAALGVLAEQTLGDTATTWSVSDTLSTDPGDSAEAALRVVREALANVRAHADARHVTIALADADGGYEVTVTDDGVGIGPDAGERPRAGHLGIATMRQRAAEVGGTCTIAAAAPAGTVITAWFPSAPRATDIDGGDAQTVP